MTAEPNTMPPPAFPEVHSPRHRAPAPELTPVMEPVMEAAPTVFSAPPVVGPDPVAGASWVVPEYVSSFVPEPPPRRGLKRLLVVGLVVVTAGVGAAVGANAFAKSRICGEFAAIGKSDNSGGSAGTTDAGGTELGGQPDAAAIRKELDQVRAFSKLLVLDTDLQEATEGLANDIDDAVAMTERPGSTGLDGLAQLMVIAGSMDNHVRAAQRSCDLPVTGILNP